MTNVGLSNKLSSEMKILQSKSIWSFVISINDGANEKLRNFFRFMSKQKNLDTTACQHVHKGFLVQSLCE